MAILHKREALALVLLGLVGISKAFQPKVSHIHRQAQPKCAPLTSATIENIEKVSELERFPVDYSGLGGKALLLNEFPSKQEVFDAIPAHCWDKSTPRSLAHAATSLGMTLGLGFAAAAILPLQGAYAIAWAAYAVVTGTVATGCWVIAHECGHGAFSNNKALQDFVGYTLHTALLVPYFSWQRSHAVHHANTNHLTRGETHVPPTSHSAGGQGRLAVRAGYEKLFGPKMGQALHGAQELVLHLVFGWPAYLLAGATGGPDRGMTNHFWPLKPFSTGEKTTELFPGAWKNKVWLSDVGIVAMLGALGLWASKAGALTVAALYGGPYLVVNCWLVLYTWLQHTDVDVPHYEAEDWNYMKGAFQTIDRPYGRVLDFLHHHIGSTHVVHHIDCTIPHYHALEATKAVEKAFPEHYLYEPTPIAQALWRVSTKCLTVDKVGDKWVFAQNK